MESRFGTKEEKQVKMLWNNFKVAFAMYSKIPMPMADWNKENMKYTFCFFPFIGLVIGALSLAVQYYAKPEIVANVPPNCFMPRPKVGSAVIRLTRHQNPPVQAKDEKLMFRIIRASFNQRRKTLANGLSNSDKIDLPKDVITEAIAKLGKGESVRGESLSLEEFAALSNDLWEKKGR